MQRTGAQWLKLTVFYIFFFIFLGCFFTLSYHIFATICITEDEPRWQQEDSLIGSNPGMGFRPMPDPDKNADSTLIWYDKARKREYSFWTFQLEEYIEKVEAGQGKLPICTLGSGATGDKDIVCRVDTKQLAPCSIKTNFGYPDGQPCVLVKLNKIFGWTPQPYGYDDRDTFSHDRLLRHLEEEKEEKDMPADLAQHIMNETAKAGNNDALRKDILSTVWISCEGETVLDRENMGEISYIPERGISGMYYPYQQQVGYQAPFMFIKFKNPKQGVVIHVTCRAFAKNVKPDKFMRLGQTNFALLID